MSTERNVQKSVDFYILSGSGTIIHVKTSYSVPGIRLILVANVHMLYETSENINIETSEI